MDIGKLRHRIEIQNYTTTDDDFGQPIKTWMARDTVWAWIRPMSGNEQLTAKQVTAEITHKVTIRYHATITVTDRIKFGSRYFDINFIGNFDERNVFMELMCKETV